MSGIAFYVIQGSYFVAAVLFILGLKRMSSPVTARRGFVWSGAGMLVAVVATFFMPGLHGVVNFSLMFAALFIGGVLAWVSGRLVAMTAMPQMVALYNGLGGGAAAAIAAKELIGGEAVSVGYTTLAVIGALIGAVSFSGSLVAFAKLQGWLRRSLRFRGQHYLNFLFVLAALAIAAITIRTQLSPWIVIFYALAVLVGILLTVPIGGADMPVVISLYNAMTGLAVGFEGFALHNAAMIVAGTVVGASGTLLTQLMAKAMNRSVANVLFSGFGEVAGAEGGAVEGSLKPIDADDVAVMLAFAEKVVIVPGYGLAVAQAQHKLWELAKSLQARGVRVIFAIHPVAGRMPGHMNVLLAEAGVPYDLIEDLDEANSEFATANVALVIGANDVVNPVARTNPDSPIYGMPILNADQADNVIVVKRGQGRGFSGIENALFYQDNTRMLYGDAQQVCGSLVQGLKAL